MRVTNRMLVDQGVGRLRERIDAFERAQRALATGRRLHVSSDDVAGMNRALGLRSTLAAGAQAIRNAEDGAMWTELADSRLSTLVDQLQRVRELVVTGINATSNPTERAAMRAEAVQAADAFASLANSRHDGRPLFAGFSAGDAVAKVAGTWAYLGDSGRAVRRVSETEQVEVSVTGDVVFGFAAGEDVLTLLDRVADQLGTGDIAGLQTSLAAVDRAMGRLLDGRAALGTAGARIEQVLLRARAEEVTLRTQLSEVEDADMAQSIMELQVQEVALQAAQGALARALQPSLAAFLR